MKKKSNIEFEAYLDIQQFKKFATFLAWLKKDQQRKMKAGTKGKKISINRFVMKSVCENCQRNEAMPNDVWCSKCRSVD